MHLYIVYEIAAKYAFYGFSPEVRMQSTRSDITSTQRWTSMDSMEVKVSVYKNTNLSQEPLDQTCLFVLICIFHADSKYGHNMQHF